MRVNKSFPGVACITLSSCLFAIKGSVMGSLFQDGLTPLAFTQISTLLTVVIMGIYLFCKYRSLFQFKRVHLISFALLGCALAANFYTYLVALQKLPLAFVAVLLNLTTIFVAGYHIFRSRRLPEIQEVGAIFLSGAGIAILVGFNISSVKLSLIGILAALLSAATYAFYILIGEHLEHEYHSYSLILYSNLFAGAALMLFRPAGLIEVKHLPASGIYLLLGAVTLGTLLPSILFLRGLERVQPTTVAMLSSCQPLLFSAVIGLLWLNQSMTFMQIFGACLIVISILILNVPIPAKKTKNLAPVIQFPVKLDEQLPLAS